MEIYNVGNRAVNLYLLDSGTHRLLIDSGFPNQLNDLGRAMRKTGYKIRDIDFLLVTHFHIDHAGAIQELKNEGVQFLLTETQLPFIKTMESMAINKWKYTPVDFNDNIILSIDDSRRFLKEINIFGEIVSTPGHTNDSITLLLDSGEAFVGDLPAENLVVDNDSAERQSWIKLKNSGARIILPGHGRKYETRP